MNEKLTGSPSTMARFECMRVNVKLLPVKVAFFCLYGGVACFLAYLSVYLRQLGLSPSESAIITGTMPFLSGFLRPTVGALADKLRRHKVILIIWAFFTGAILIMILLVPPTDDATSYNHEQMTLKPTCSQNDSIHEICLESNCGHANISSFKKYIKNNCSMDCVKTGADKNMSEMNTRNQSFTVELGNINNVYLSSELNCLHIDMNIANNELESTSLCTSPSETFDCILTCSHGELDNDTVPPMCTPQHPKKFGRTFWLAFWLYFMGSIFYYPSFGLLDACSYQLQDGQTHTWGLQRVWGTVGYALLGFGSGFLMDLLAGGGSPNYAIPFGTFLACQMILVLTVGTFQTTRDVKSTALFRDVGSLLTNAEVNSLLIVLFAFGFYMGVIEGILFWYLKSLGAPQTVLGLSLCANSVLEIIMLGASSPIIARIGNVWCIYLACIAYAVRFLAYGLIQNPWLVLLPDLLNGLTFALMYSSASVYAARIAPPGTAATVQNLIRAVHYSFGRGSGFLVGGPLLEWCGGPNTFFAAAVASILTLVYYAATQAYIRHCSAAKMAPPSAELQNDLLPTPIQAESSAWPEHLRSGTRLAGAKSAQGVVSPDEMCPLSADDVEKKA